MPKDYQAQEEKKSRVSQLRQKSVRTATKDDQAEGNPLVDLQQKIGNQAVQRLIAQREEAGEYELGDETAARINQARGGGQPLDEAISQQMGASLGQDFSEVRAHTSAESDQLNQELGARAFTTGQDIFFRDGEYNPHSGAGQELIAHELTHVVQQQRGDVAGGDRMRVNAPGDAFEQEADAVARAVVQEKPETILQQWEAQPEEEDVQAKPVQRQEEDELMMQAEEEEEEEEMVQPALVQKQEDLEEEEVQLKRLQRQEEEEEVMLQPLEEEEEMIQPKRRS